MARALLWLVPVLHCIFAIYVFGNTDIFYEFDQVSDFTGGVSVDSGN